MIFTRIGVVFVENARTAEMRKIKDIMEILKQRIIKKNIIDKEKNQEKPLFIKKYAIYVR